MHHKHSRQNTFKSAARLAAEAAFLPEPPAKMHGQANATQTAGGRANQRPSTEPNHLATSLNSALSKVLAKPPRVFRVVSMSQVGLDPLRAETLQAVAEVPGLPTDARKKHLRRPLRVTAPPVTVVYRAPILESPVTALPEKLSQFDPLSASAKAEDFAALRDQLAALDETFAIIRSAQSFRPFD